MYAAQKEIAKRVGARHDYDVSVYAATETEPLAAAIEHEKTLPEETPGIEEGDKITRKSKPSIETQAVAHIQQQIPEEAPIVEGGKVERATKPTIETTTKPKLAAFVEVAEKLEGAPVEMKGNKELHDYADMNPEAADVMGWPDKDKAILVDEHQPQKTEVKDVVQEVVEIEEMKQGESYHDAHHDALKAETTSKRRNIWRKRFRKSGNGRQTKGNHPKIVKVHDDGDLTVKKGDTNYVVTTEGKTFKEVKPEPELKDVIQHSHELGEKATREGQAVSRGAHNAEKVGSTPRPLPKKPSRSEKAIRYPRLKIARFMHGTASMGKVIMEVRNE